MNVNLLSLAIPILALATVGVVLGIFFLRGRKKTDGAAVTAPPPVPNSPAPQQPASKTPLIISVVILFVITIPLGIFLVSQRQLIGKRATSFESCQAPNACIPVFEGTTTCPDGRMVVPNLSCTPGGGPPDPGILCCTPKTSVQPTVTESPTPPVNNRLTPTIPSEQSPTNTPPTASPTAPAAGVTASPTPTQTSPTNPPGLGGPLTCQQVKLYSVDGQWTPLNQTFLQNIRPGDTLIIAIAGTGAPSSPNQTNCARFKVNNEATWHDIACTSVHNGEFYSQYTIPSGTTRFHVEAELL